MSQSWEQFFIVSSLALLEKYFMKYYKIQILLVIPHEDQISLFSNITNF